MATIETTEATAETVADLLDRLGSISPARVLLKPPIGAATEADLIRVNAGKAHLCELVDGTLVAKAVGLRESLLTGAIVCFLRDFIVPRNLGLVVGPDAILRLVPGLLRAPDVSFIAWDRFPGRRLPEDPIPTVAADLAIEVLSESNTRKEMARKRREYFAAGTRLVWEVEPKDRTVTVYDGPESATVLGGDDVLDGGDVLAGFALALRDLFAELDRQGG